MVRLKAVIAYDGTAFAGYQVQPGQRTVQGEIEKVLEKMHKGSFIRISGSGRTDAGVHAVGQVIHFDSPLNIPIENWSKALGALLPNDISIIKIEQVLDDFHARFDAIRKEYHYRILNRNLPDVFRRQYTYHIPYELDLDEMREAATHLVGTHDFTSFCASGTHVIDKVRTIYSLDVESQGDEVVIKAVGSGFLYQMVRIIVGNLLEVGKGKATTGDILGILEAKDRRQAFATAPPQGLYLWAVGYKNMPE